MAGEKSSQRSSKGGVTIMDVARESGVSYSTVSRALSGYMYVAESTRQRVLEAADRLGYVVNLQARSLAGGRSNLIGILVPGLDTGYVGAIARGIDKELREAGYDLILYTTHRNLHKEMLHVKAIMNGPADGLLLLLPLMQADYQVLLQEQRFPYVLIDQNDPSGNSTTVQSTNEQGAYEATQYLITLGHQRIAHITGFMSLGSAKDRLEGY
jgi:LacI family transcriptional regulator